MSDELLRDIDDWLAGEIDPNPRGLFERCRSALSIVAPPRCPTEAMFEAGQAECKAAWQNGTWADADSVWNAMCDAAPKTGGSS